MLGWIAPLCIYTLPSLTNVWMSQDDMSNMKLSCTIVHHFNFHCIIVTLFAKTYLYVNVGYELCCIFLIDLATIDLMFGKGHLYVYL
jgi:hypothetical protein